VVKLLCECLIDHPKTSYGGQQRLINQTFWHIKIIDVDKKIEYTCSTIKGTKDVHFVRSIDSIDVNKLLKKSLACFCCFCVDSDFSTCENLAWIEQ
jgi:hypothetical protein